MEADLSPFHAVRMAQQQPKYRKTYLRAWREFRDRSLESVATQMGMTHGQLSKIERGIHPYSQGVLETAALEYGCSVTDLLTRAPNPITDRLLAPRRKA